ncbi:hypothetical protein L1887_03918 [Cichorium endivia]|nr:hypothetical protein L1887_03918 [Cichorium endivia]
MQASLLSSDHGSSFCKSKEILCSQRLPFKPDSPRHLKYNYTFTSCTSLSTTLNAPYKPNLISPRTTLTWRGRSNNGRVVPSLLCGNSSTSLSANSGSDDSSGRSVRGWIEVVGMAISIAFPIWVALGCFLGLTSPDSLNSLEPKWTMMIITFTMLGMGMTLTFDDLKGALTMPKELFMGFFLQYSVMPLSAFYISKILKLPSYYAAGLIMVGCCPGGTASNIVTYIARGNVALSVLLTVASTLSAMVMTPLLAARLAGKYVTIDPIGLLKPTFQVVLLPVLVGTFMNHYFKGAVKFVSPLMPPIAAATVGVLCGNAIPQGLFAILTSGQLVFAVILLHTSGFFFGYILSRILGVDVSSSRTISLAVGMQNSVLGFDLAARYYWNPLTAMPCAVSIVCNLVLGSILAGRWRLIMPETQEVKRDP